MRTVRLHGELFIMTEGGAITKEDDYQNGLASYAHLCDDGVIRRYGKQIGTKADLEILGECDNMVKNEAAFLWGILTDLAWFEEPMDKEAK